MDRILVKDRIKVLNDRSKNLALRFHTGFKAEIKFLKAFVIFNDFPYLGKHRKCNSYDLSRTSWFRPKSISENRLKTYAF